MSSPNPNPSSKRSYLTHRPSNPPTTKPDSEERPSTSAPTSPSPPPDPVAAVEDEDDNDQDQHPSLPLSMSTSLLLSTHLPPDTTSALITLHSALDPPTQKVNVRFQAIGNAPILKQKVFKISAAAKFGTVVAFLRKKTGVGVGGADAGSSNGEGLFCYVNSVFAPGLDEGVGNLFRCFKTDDQLIVAYSKTPAFG